jgi:hypothetical protein
MKTIMIIAAIAMVAIAAIGGGYYSYLQNSNAQVTVMYDITDTLQPVQDTTNIKIHVTNFTSQWGETNIRFLTISDFSETKPKEIFIPAQFPLLSNPYDRDVELQKASSSISMSLKSLTSDSIGKRESVIFKPVVNELNRLAKTSAHTKELIVFSDLQENKAHGFSAYRPADSLLIRSNAGKVKKLFEQQVTFENLKGVTLYLVYEARTPVAQENFLAMANIWKSIFTSH